MAARIHKGILQLPEGEIKSVVQYLWEISCEYRMDVPSITSYEDGACVQWGGDVICYLFIEDGCVVIEVDIAGNITHYKYPTERDKLESLFRNFIWD